jgi:hypothetical protein
MLLLSLFASPAAVAKKQNVYAATPNLSFPVVMTTTIQKFYQQIYVDDLDGVVEPSDWKLGYDSDADGLVDTTDPTLGVPVPIAVTEDISNTYTGSYYQSAESCTYTVDAVTGEAIDINTDNDDGTVTPGVLDGIVNDADLTCVPLTEYAPWYPQPRVTSTTDPNLIWNTTYVSDYRNSWQADWANVAMADAPGVVDIAFIDWGNPLENIRPTVGQRFPVEVTLHTKVADWVDGALADTSMTGYRMGCLEYESSQTELFGTSAFDTAGFTYESAFATVLTTQFRAEVQPPTGPSYSIPLEPGIGPSGKMNLASAGGGWIPTMAGLHRITLYVSDPLISFEGAVVNNDEHYVMTTGAMAQRLSSNKVGLSWVQGNVTWIDVDVVAPSGGGKNRR